jgi:hypothetical protein
MKKFIKLFLFPIFLMLGSFAGGIYFGQNLEYKIFSSIPTYLNEEPVSFTVEPIVCTNTSTVLDCHNVLDNDEETTWVTSTDSCIDSSILFTFDDYKYIEFLLIDETVNNYSSNVREIQIEGNFGKKIVVLDSPDDSYEWIDLKESGYEFEVTILSLYEEEPSSFDCGISEITFIGSDYFWDY